MKGKKQRVTVTGDTLVIEYPTIGKTFRRDLTDYPKEIYTPCEAARHGIKQKFGDAASGGTPQEKWQEVQAIDEALMAGNWERTATPDLTPLILEAVARIKKVPAERLQKVAEKAPEKVKEWGSNLKVRAEIARIRAERAAERAKAAADDLEIDLN